MSWINRTKKYFILVAMVMALALILISYHSTGYTVYTNHKGDNSQEIIVKGINSTKTNTKKLTRLIVKTGNDNHDTDTKGDNSASLHKGNNSTTISLSLKEYETLLSEVKESKKLLMESLWAKELKNDGHKDRGKNEFSVDTKGRNRGHLNTFDIKENNNIHAVRNSPSNEILENQKKQEAYNKFNEYRRKKKNPEIYNIENKNTRNEFQDSNLEVGMNPDLNRAQNERAKYKEPVNVVSNQDRIRNSETLNNRDGLSGQRSYQNKNQNKSDQFRNNNRKGGDYSRNLNQVPREKSGEHDKNDLNRYKDREYISTQKTTQASKLDRNEKKLKSEKNRVKETVFDKQNSETLGSVNVKRNNYFSIDRADNYIKSGDFEKERAIGFVHGQNEQVISKSSTVATISDNHRQGERKSNDLANDIFNRVNERKSNEFKDIPRQPGLVYNELKKLALGQDSRFKSQNNDLSNQNNGNLILSNQNQEKSTNELGERNDDCDACFHYKFKYLINQKTICKRRYDVDLLVVILTAPDEFDERSAIRDTWGKLCNSKQSKLVCVFIIGLVTDEEVKNRIAMESNEHKDIVQLDFVEAYANLTYKTLSGLRWASEYCQNAKYIMKTDGDMYVNLELIPIMLEAAPSSMFLGGYCWGISTPHREPESKWYVPFRSYTKPKFPPMCSGTGYIMSKDVVNGILKTSRNIPFFHLEDVYIALCTQKLGVSPVRIQGFFNLREGFSDCYYRNRVMTSHYIKPDMLREYWRESRSCDLEHQQPNDLYVKIDYPVVT